MKKQTLINQNAPQAIGPYSPSVKMGHYLFISGQIPFDPEAGTMVEGDIIVQTRRVLENLKLVLFPYAIGLENVVKTTIFLKDMHHFAQVNEIYGQYFKTPHPARSCVEIARLPKDAAIEIEAIAYCDK